MSRTPRIDAHQHFWRLADRAGHWPPPALGAIHRDFTPGDFEPLRRAAGIDGTVVVQSMPSEQETRQLLGLPDRHDFILGVVGWVDLKAPEAPQRIAALAAHPKLKGLRPMLQDLDDDAWIADAAVDPSARAMCAHGLVFDALVLTRHLGALDAFAARHPGLAIVIDHGAKPPIARGEIEPWRRALAPLAARPNVHCKVSGLLTEAGEHRSAQALQPYVQALWTLFGAARLLWGSDWPVLRLAADYGAWLDMCELLFSTIAPELGDSQRAALFGGHAQRLYRLHDQAGHDRGPGCMR
ncbi:amidohydrolase family protein [Aquincola sp. S2]|uniref:Amidohydrolase family protein n=1 Tax=Pseudaquabacterium terrae TaxID=2732868 RepID=A0ABX2ESK8_9BURK|nr:amidohydrolase family protein [Aquabacterium terrae]NRF71690.1 amidohydrolase family protein [Aquabacterium terrae]